MAGSIDSNTTFKISAGVLCTLMLGGIGMTLNEFRGISATVIEVGTTNKVMVEQIKHTNLRLDETNRHLEAIDIKTDGQISRLTELHRLYGELGVRVGALESRVFGLERQGDK